MAALPVCPPSPKELLAAELKKYDPRGKFGQDSDDKIADKANASEGLFDVPSVMDLLNQAGEFLSGVASDLVSTVALDSLSDLAGSVLGSSGILSLMVAINMLGDSMSMMLQMFVIDNLRKQVAIRLYWLRLVETHARAVYKLLLMLRGVKDAPTSYAKIIMALRHVKAAEIAIKKFKQLEDPTLGVPKIKANMFRRTFIESDQALFILMDNSSTSAAAQILATGLRRSVTMKGIDKKIFNKAAEEAFAVAKKQAIAKVLGRAVYIAEGLVWHLLRLMPPVPIPGAYGIINTADKAGFSFDNAAKLGYIAGDRFKTDAAEQEISLIKEQGLRKYLSVEKSNPTAADLQKVFNKVDEFDFEKGLAGTNLVVTGYIDSILTFKSTWAQLNEMSNYLLSVATPIENILSTVRSGMEKSIAEKDSKMMMDLKKVSWVAKLSLLDTYKKMFAGTINDQAQRADQARNLELLKIYLASDEVQLATDGRIPELLVRLQAVAPLGYVNTRASNEALVMINLIIKENRKYIKYNEKLFSKLSTVSLQHDPSIGAVSDLLTAMGVAGGLAGAMASAITLGQLAELANLMAISVAALQGLKALGIPKCTVPAKSEDSEANRNRDIEAAMKKQTQK